MSGRPPSARWRAASWGLLAAGASAHAGSLDGEISADLFTASSVSTQEGAGEPEQLSAFEIGSRIRLDLLELDDRLGLELDYRGREPLALQISPDRALAEVQNSPIRLLYAAEARYEVAPEALTVGAGRFLAPSLIFLPVDGARAIAQAGDSEIEAFGGRRGVTTSWRSVPLDTFLPAAGLAWRYLTLPVQAEVSGAWARDEAILTTGLDETAQTYGAASGLAQVMGRPEEAIAMGAQAAFAQQATYVLGPSWADLTLEVEAIGLWSGGAFADWRPSDAIQIDYDAHYQRVGAWRAGTVEGDEVVSDLQDPNFLDNRLRAAWAPLPEAGWVRGDVRIRRRTDRWERRYGLRLDADQLPLGTYASGRVYWDDQDPDDPDEEDGDRLLWAASGGWRGAGLDAEVGASVIDRSAAPWSSRRDDAPIAGEDLSPFVLEAQGIFFARAFYSGQRAFVGLDYEASLADAERRILIQAGALTRSVW